MNNSLLWLSFITFTCSSLAFAQAPHGLDLEKVKKLFNQPTTGAAGTTAGKSVSPKKNVSGPLKEGVRSAVEVKCIEQQHKLAEYEITSKILLGWLKTCRTNFDSQCQIYETQEDALCFARIKSYSPFELSGKEEIQINQDCQIYLMNCPQKQQRDNE